MKVRVLIVRKRRPPRTTRTETLLPNKTLFRSRFPGAPDVQRFWANIRNGVESVSRFSVDDLEIGAQSTGDRPSELVCAKGLLDDIVLFDARFFGYLPPEAEVMDPQHGVFVEICWNELEPADSTGAG